MNQRTFDALELPKIRARLANYTSFSAGKELALALLPATQQEAARFLQQQVREAQRLLELRPNFSLGGAHDVRPALRQAALGGVLEAGTLLEVQDTLAAARQTENTLSRWAEELPALQDLSRELTADAFLEAEFERSLGPRGEVKDGASPLLSRIRGEIRVAHHRLMTRLEELLHSPRGQQVLQDPLITQRGGRYVVPVKAEFRGEFRGIVHDVSGSGATVFMEPLEMVELGNAWRELQLKEEREVERVLRRLSGLVGERAEAMVQNVACLALLDLALAKAKYGQSIHGSFPDLLSPDLVIRGEGGEWQHPPLRLIDARHPLLTGQVVPITVEVGQDYFILVITGPNTGGKTVALKTVGLLALMAQSGLPVPADEGSQIPVFGGIYADIGDEQSIEQSLSTFSSHMGNIIRILREARSDSLVLLDELGAGTDPAEGSALARAILTHLRERGIMTVATTHHSELKAFAHGTPGVRNASVEFDPETLAPTYRLTLGLPGRSNAMAIAARLGLPQEVVDAARRLLGPAQLQTEALLHEIQRERDLAREDRRAGEGLRAEAQAVQDLLDARWRELEAEGDRIVAEVRQEAERQLTEVRRQLREASAELEAALREQARDRLKTASRMVEEVGAGLKPAPARPRQESPAQPVPLEVRPGASVYVQGLGQRGEVLAGPDAAGQVEVQMGAFKVRAQLQDLTLVEGEVGTGFKPAPPRGISAAPAVGPELHLRGLRAEEALERLERYLDQAYMAGHPSVRIIHGKGTGVLRELVRERLRGHPLVRSYAVADARSGGEGVTVAELAL